MANYTKQTLEGSLQKLMKNRRLNDISVKDLIADCGMNRKTIYYHYSSIAALLMDILERDLRAAAAHRTLPSNWKEGGAGAVDIHRDIIFPERVGHRFGHAAEAPLCSRIFKRHRRFPEGRLARSVDDLSALRLVFHDLDCRLGAQEHGDHVNIERAFHILGAYRVHFPDRADAGVIDENIQPAERLFDFCEYPIDCTIVQHVSGGDEAIDAFRPDRLAHRCKAVSAAR